MDPASGATSDNEVATQHLKSLLGFFGGGGSSVPVFGGGGVTGNLLNGGGGGGESSDGLTNGNGDARDSLTNAGLNSLTVDADEMIPTFPSVPSATLLSSPNAGVDGVARSSSAREPETPSRIANRPSSISDPSATPPRNSHCAVRTVGDVERIELSGEDEGNFYAISGKKVDIVASEEKTGRLPGSNKVKIKPVVNYEFEHRYYPGEMVAIYHQGYFVAYVLKGAKGQGLVRVFSRRSSERLLLKGFQGRVTDLNFSHSEQALLACVDEAGYLYVYEISERGGKIASRVVLLVDTSCPAPSDRHRVFWCPFIPEGPNDVEISDDDPDVESRLEDARKLLVVTHGEKAEMWHVDYVGKKYGNKPLKGSDVETGCLKINSHKEPITVATFAPDGTALATASLDGEVKFFQVYLPDKKEPRCLHQWKPHDGRPVSSLLFLDDHQTPNPSMHFWKFAVTGCDNNTEIKLWSCEDWSCLQTLRFLPFSPMGLSSPSPPPPPEIKVVADLSFKYLVLSDTRKKVLYVLAVQQDSESQASFLSISEFGLSSPALSFCVYDVSLRPYKRSTSASASKVEEESSEAEAAAQSNQVVAVLRMYSIHTKMIQELQIQCVPETASTTPSRVSSQQSSQDDVISIHDGLTDVSSIDSAPESPSQQNSVFSNKSVTLKPKTVLDSTPLLLSPDAFASPTSPRRRIDHVASPSLAFIAPPTPSLLPQISAIGSDPANLSGSGSTLTGVTSLSSTTEEPRLPLPLPHLQSPREGGLQRESNGVIANELLQDMFNMTLKAQHEENKKTETVDSNRSTPSSRSSSTSMEVSEILQGTKSKDDAPKHLEITPSALLSDAIVAPTLDVEIEEDEEEPTLRPAPETSDSPPKNGSQFFENSDDDDDEDEDVLAADGGDEDEGDEEEEEEDDAEKSRRSGAAYPRNVAAATSCVKSPPIPAVPCSSSSSAPAAPSTLASDDAPVLKVSSHPSTTQWPKAPLIDVPKEAKIHQAPKAKSDQVVGEIHAQATGTVFRQPTAAAAATTGLTAGFSETSDRDDEDEDEVDDDDGEESYSISSTSSSPRSKPSQLPKREKARNANIDVKSPAPSRIPAVTSESYPSHDPDSSSYHIAHQSGPSGAGVAVNGGQSFDSMNQTLQTILEMLQSQQKEISQLQNQSRPAVAPPAARIGLDELEGSISQKLDAAVEQLREVHQERLSAAVNDMAANQAAAAAAAAAATKNSTEDQNAAKAQQEALLASVNHTLSSTVANRMERAVKEEFKRLLVPTVKTSMEPLKNIVQAELSQKLTTTDHALRESVSKMVRSRQAVEAIGQAAGQALQGPIQASYQEAFKSHVIPVFEKACNTMFTQINGSFQKGTKEYMHNMEKELNGLRKKYLDQKDPIVHQLQTMVDSFATSQQQILQANQELIQRTINQQMDHYHNIAQANLQQTIQQIVRQELKESLTHHHAQIAALIPPADTMAMLRSGAATPVPQGGGSAQDYQSEIKGLLKKRDIAGAFKVALTTSDLAIVSYLCQKINPADVFPSNGSTTLTQPIILSLIQQLAANLMDHTDMKLEYLSEALMALDDSSQVTAEHLGTLLPILVQNLQAFMSSHPENKKTKRVLVLAKGLVK